MDIVVDANIIFSSLIKGGKTAELLLSFSLNLFTPEFVIEEIEEHKKEIFEKGMSEDELNSTLSLIKEIIRIIPKEDFSDKLEEARNLSPDVEDAVYFALALKLNCPIWSNDKRLKGQNLVKVYSTIDLTEKFKL
ncbi:DNA-binding protein [Candidatus Woesearchaeota archaeon CG10_big_fil_rev_8_21_14_0_10_34_12]|nr:MAG: DNA-binding protein [Candidatus Woesearchaeota archaeon CG10_big_fil_rev_8_21_14_0_10_34_12]